MAIRLPEPTRIKDEELRTFLHQLIRELRDTLNDLETKDKTHETDLADLARRFDEFLLDIYG